MQQLSSSENQTIIFRLTALWALNESGLGGFLHALNFPFTGLIVGSIAVALISFILYFSNVDRAILFNSLVIVLIIKLLMSPHSSVTAYFAVSFQAICAYCFYRLLGINLVSILLVCILSFLESASQKLLTLTLIGGMPFWNAINMFIDNVSKQLFKYEFNHGSLWLISFYFSVYIFFAILSAFFIYSLIEQLKNLNLSQRENDSLKNFHNITELRTKKPRPKWLRILLYSGIIIFVLMTFLIFDKEQFKDNFLTYYFLRTISIVLFWYYILMPGIMKLIKKYLNKRIPLFQNEVDEIINLFPKLKVIIYYAWNESALYRGLRRLKYFFTLTLIEILTYK